MSKYEGYIRLAETFLSDAVNDRYTAETRNSVTYMALAYIELAKLVKHD
jgi:hypothetical protein